MTKQVRKRSKATIEKVAAALRGRKRPAHVVEKVAAANRGKKRTPEQRLAMSERVKKGIADGKYVATGDALKRKLANLEKGRGKENRDYTEWGRKHSIKMKGRKRDKAAVDTCAAILRGREQTATKTKKGPTNANSLVGTLRSPRNVVYKFVNLAHFVRENEGLFADEDVAWRPTGKNGAFMVCRAYKGLNNLFGHGKSVPSSWKGWTIVIDVEKQGDDLLGRECLND